MEYEPPPTTTGSRRQFQQQYSSQIQSQINVHDCPEVLHPLTSLLPSTCLPCHQGERAVEPLGILLYNMILTVDELQIRQGVQQQIASPSTRVSAYRWVASPRRQDEAAHPQAQATAPLAASSQQTSLPTVVTAGPRAPGAGQAPTAATANEGQAAPAPAPAPANEGQGDATTVTATATANEGQAVPASADQTATATVTASSGPRGNSVTTATASFTAGRQAGSATATGMGMGWTSGPSRRPGPSAPAEGRPRGAPPPSPPPRTPRPDLEARFQIFCPGRPSSLARTSFCWQWSLCSSSTSRRTSFCWQWSLWAPAAITTPGLRGGAASAGLAWLRRGRLAQLWRAWRGP